MKKYIGFIIFILIIIFAIISVFIKKDNNITNTNNTNIIDVDEELEGIPEGAINNNKIINVHREDVYHEYNRVELNEELKEGYLFLKSKTNDALNRLEIKLSLYDSNENVIFIHYLDIDKEKISKDGFLSFKYEKSLSSAVNYSINVERKPSTD